MAASDPATPLYLLSDIAANAAGPNVAKVATNPGLEAFFKSALSMNVYWVYEYYRKHEIAAVAHLNATHGLQLRVGAHPLALFRVLHNFYEI